MFEMLRMRVPQLASVTLSSHCHNDLGLAVANILAAIASGAQQVECTINGIGERAGNAALDEIAAALMVRSDQFPCTHSIVLERLYPTSQLLSKIISFGPSPNKTVVGSNAFAHEAGIHQHGVLANPLTYEIMNPASVGVPHGRIVLGKHSGRSALAQPRSSKSSHLLGPRFLQSPKSIPRQISLFWAVTRCWRFNAFRSFERNYRLFFPSQISLNSAPLLNSPSWSGNVYA
jgi:2-isopropylmalate synthase